jgi:hypothetical protein
LTKEAAEAGLEVELVLVDEVDLGVVDLDVEDDELGLEAELVGLEDDEDADLEEATDSTFRFLLAEPFDSK